MPRGVYKRTPEHNKNLGDSNRGKIRSPEFCKNRSESQKKFRPSKESNAKRSATLKGRPRPQEVRDRIVASNIGKKHNMLKKRPPHTEATREKLRIAKLGTTESEETK